jgi:hypothetical protein
LTHGPTAADTATTAVEGEAAALIINVSGVGVGDFASSVGVGGAQGQRPLEIAMLTAAAESVTVNCPPG